MENFSVTATPVKAEHTLMWIALGTLGFRHSLDELCRITGIGARFALEHGLSDSFLS
jgi:hypothetical protein